MSRVLWKRYGPTRHYEISVSTQFVIGAEYDGPTFGFTVFAGPFEFWTIKR